MIKKILLTLSVLTLLLLTFFILPTKPYALNFKKEHNVTKDKIIYIVRHGWHTGIVLPSFDIKKRLPMLKKRFHNVNYIEVGWGDQGYYMSKEITTELTLQAMLIPTQTVIHAVGFRSNPNKFFIDSPVKKVCLSEKEYLSLLHFIESSFKKDENNKLESLREGIYGNSQFFRGNGKYYVANTCNKWTAKGLKSAGLDIYPDFKLSADSISDYLKNAPTCEE